MYYPCHMTLLFLESSTLFYYITLVCDLCDIYVTVTCDVMFCLLYLCPNKEKEKKSSK